VLALPPSKPRRTKKKRPSGQQVQHKGIESIYPAHLTPFLPYAVLTFLAGVFFWKILTPVETSRYWLWEDFLYQNYPYRVFAATSLARGIFPFWNPYVFGGQPFFADIQTAVLYPFNLIQALLTRGDSLNPYLVELIEILHYLLAAVFTYRFLRTCRLVREASLLGAVTFAFSGFMVTHVIHMNFIYVFIWLPLVLETFEKALSGRKFRYAVLCAVFLALSNMGGYPQYSLYIYYTLALYWLIFELEQRQGSEWSLKGARNRLLCLAFVTVAALGLNAFSYLPAAELAQYTPRSSMSYVDSVEHSINPFFLVKLFCPTFFGIQYPQLRTYWAGPHGAFWETCIFVGVLPLILALWALRAFRVNRHVQFAAVIAGISLWLALGQYGLLYKLFFYFAPGFDRFRIPGRFSALLSFALALLAAHGWSMLIALRKEVRRKYFQSGIFFLSGTIFALALLLLALLHTHVLDGFADGKLAEAPIKEAAKTACLVSLAWIAASVVILAITGTLSRAWEKSLGVLAILFVFAELYIFGTPFLEGQLSPADLYQQNEFVRMFQEEGKKELFRINARSLEQPGIMLLRRNQGSLDRLFLIEGYNPLQLKRRLGEIEVGRRFDLLNVKYRIKVDLERELAGFSINRTYLPRAFMVHRWRVIQESEEILSVLDRADFDYRAEAIVEKPPGIDSAEPGGHIESEIEITGYSQNEIVIESRSREPGILILSEWYYPAWRVWVDGKEGEVLRTDHALRGVALQPGSHIVRFAYRSKTFRLGATASLFTALCILGASLAFLRRRRF